MVSACDVITGHITALYILIPIHDHFKAIKAFACISPHSVNTISVFIRTLVVTINTFIKIETVHTVTDITLVAFTWKWAIVIRTISVYITIIESGIGAFVNVRAVSFVTISFPAVIALTHEAAVDVRTMSIYVAFVRIFVTLINVATRPAISAVPVKTGTVVTKALISWFIDHKNLEITIGIWPQIKVIPQKKNLISKLKSNFIFDLKIKIYSKLHLWPQNRNWSQNQN